MQGVERLPQRPLGRPVPTEGTDYTKPSCLFSTSKVATPTHLDRPWTRRTTRTFFQMAVTSSSTSALITISTLHLILAKRPRSDTISTLNKSWRKVGKLLIGSASCSYSRGQPLLKMGPHGPSQLSPPKASHYSFNYGAVMDPYMLDNNHNYE